MFPVIDTTLLPRMGHATEACVSITSLRYGGRFLEHTVYARSSNSLRSRRKTCHDAITRRLFSALPVWRFEHEYECIFENIFRFEIEFFLALNVFQNGCHVTLFWTCGCDWQDHPCMTIDHVTFFFFPFYVVMWLCWVVSCWFVLLNWVLFL